MEDLFVSVTSNTQVRIEPKDINNKIDDTILKRIKNDLEGKCIKEGFVKEKSIKVLKRSMGQGQTSAFNGAILFNIQYSMDICRPLQGALIEVQAININKMGVLAGVPYEQPSPLNVLLAKQHHIDNETFESIKPDDIFKVKVVGSRYEYGDTQITIIAVLEEVFDQFNSE
jgi:DNA-directed RNA polymerase subunit E'/Rpb7